MTDGPSYLGIDLGTGSVKAAVVTAGAEVLAQSSCSYPVNSPHPGWAESDPQQWLAAVQGVTSDVLTDHRPVSVGFSGQMHGVVITDENLTPLRPAILWADARSVSQVASLAKAVSPDQLCLLGSPAVPGFAATSVAWLYENEPQVMERARYALQPKDWLRAILGGTIATDPSDATGTLLCDVVQVRWSPIALEWAGVSPELLPRILGSTDAAGVITLGESGKVHELPAVVGAADTACALAGLGLQAGDGFIAVGTGSQIVSVMSRPVLDGSLLTHTFAIAGDAGAGWYRLGAVQNAGLSLTAVLSLFGADVAEANAAMAGGVQESDPIFVPYVAGERTPFMDARIRGSWHGISLSTDRQSMLRSIMEGVAQAVALGVAALTSTGSEMPEVVPLVGGGTHDPVFRQLLADATGLTLGVTDAPNAAVIGAGLLGAQMVRASAPAVASAIIEPSTQQGRVLEERRKVMVGYVREQQTRNQKSVDHPIRESS